MKLEELQVYQIAMDIGEDVYQLAGKWEYFDKDTIGKQLVRSMDSVAANISEGFGRYHFNENKHFLFYARGSLYEVKTWITKANKRKLISDIMFEEMIQKLEELGVKLNNYIKSIGSKQ